MILPLLRRRLASGYRRLAKIVGAPFLDNRSQPTISQPPPAFAPAACLVSYTAPSVPVCVPNNEGWMNRHVYMNERLAKGGVDLVFIGDSITQRWEEDRGQAVWAKYYERRRAVNLGNSWDGTQHVLWRLRNGNLHLASPRLVVLLVGTNNSEFNTPEEIAGGVEAILEEIRARAPAGKVLLMGVFPRGADPANSLRGVIRETNDRIALLGDGQRVHYLDISDAFLEMDGSLSLDVMWDYLHLTEKGFRIWAESIEPMVARLLEA